MKKIGDNELLDMIRAGKSQKECAAHFGVSSVAVCKRLKRLLPQAAEVLDKYDLTDQQKQFVIEKAKGRTNTEAAMSSYEVSSLQSAKVVGSQLMAKPEIRTAIADLMEMRGIGREYRVVRLGEHMKHPDPLVSLRALDIGFKLDGYQDRDATPPLTTITINVVGPDQTETVVLEAVNRRQGEKYRS